ncbi:hypothetical protein AMTR_s00053p00212860 [Amborella trichopoda]|uniref:Uncharacterized protein n=1 Tax=Amborella trichopoda TaxID=13333 RepID=W1P5P1_AMBTC|nr:hypothetical protein AMTR_s00053p00212860 [Amborella trichopoda]
MTVGLSETEKKCIAAFVVDGLVSSSEEAIAAEIICMIAEEVLDAKFMLDLKSREIASLRQIVVHLYREVEHHQNMFDFYQGELE